MRYDAVRSNPSAMWTHFLGDRNDYGESERMKDRVKGNYADIEAYMGFYDRWVALYYSKSPAAGEPIEAVKGKEPIVTRGEVNPPEGYRPLTLVIGSRAEDINSVEIAEKQGTPLYAFFTGKAGERVSGNIVSDDGSYVTKVRFSYDDDKQNAINRLKKGDYEYFDVNLSLALVTQAMPKWEWITRIQHHTV